MQYLLEILFVCLLFCLYGIFIFAKDNFILLRKNVTLEQLFNFAFLDFIVSIIVARIIYVFEHFSLNFLNPLVFFLFPYFPGLSLAGGMVTSILYLYYLTKKKKLPFWNIFDIFSLSIFLSISLGLLLLFIIDIFIIKKLLYVFLVGSVVEIVLFGILATLYIKNKIKDGSLGFLTFALINFSQFLIRMFLRGKASYFKFTPEDILLGVTVIVLLIFCIRQENMQITYKRK